MPRVLGVPIMPQSLTEATCDFRQHIPNHIPMTSEEQILKDIKNFGWHAMAVHGNDDHLTYLYTIGLYKTFGFPELFISGLEAPEAFKRIKEIIESLKSGKQIQPKAENIGITSNTYCYFDYVDKTTYNAFFSRAVWFYQNNDFPILQYVWPDRWHCYPWQETNGPVENAQDLLIDIPR